MKEIIDKVMDLPLENINGSLQRHRDANFEMKCESCGKNHYAPLFDGWVCDCNFSIILEYLNNTLVNRRLNDKKL